MQILSSDNSLVNIHPGFSFNNRLIKAQNKFLAMDKYMLPK